MDKKYFSSTEKLFAEYLHSNGYPQDAVLYDTEWIAVDGRRRYRPDFVIVEPSKKEVLAIIEVKDCEIGSVASSIYKQLHEYRVAIGKTTIPVFLVSRPADSDDSVPLRLYKFNQYNEAEEVDISLFPSFSSLANSASVKRKDSLKVETKKTTDAFKLITTILAILAICIVILDFVLERSNIKLLTAERLTLIGAAMAFLLIPYVQKFKGLGVEWEREK